jgi:phosphopantothenoylcysteine decarboxylase/phosphopantothenate--cysteine ligase
LLAEVDAVIATAAVSDFRPRGRLPHKGKKTEIGLEWAMERTPDVLATLSRERRPGTVMVGFAAETEDVETHGAAKRKDKGLDWVVANRVSSESGFGDLPYEASVIGPKGVEVVLTDKAAVARAVLDRIRWRKRGRA